MKMAEDLPCFLGFSFPPHQHDNDLWMAHYRDGFFMISNKSCGATSDLCKKLEVGSALVVFVLLYGRQRSSS